MKSSTMPAAALNALSVLITDHGYTKAGFARAVGISPQAMCRRLRGDTDFTADEIRKIVEVLHMSPRSMMRLFFS